LERITVSFLARGIGVLRYSSYLIYSNERAPRLLDPAFHFEGGEAFALIDLQKQATTTLNPKDIEVPDALELELGYFLDLLSKKRTVIKTLLMDQHLLRGIGNSYADEILYHAGISPLSIARAIPEKEARKLFKGISSVRNVAISKIARENGDELNGELRDFMQVHGATIRQTHKGEKVLSGKIGGRKIYYTENQVVFK